MTTPAERLTSAIGRWNAGDLEGYLSLYAPDVKLHGYAPEPMGKEAVRGFYAMIFASLPAAGRPNPVLEIEDMLTAGNRLACRAAMSGVHTGPFMGVAATGRPYHIKVITILEFRDGLVSERWSQADLLGLMVQIGALPPPG